MSLTDINNESRYLISTEEDELWGLVVTSVGSQTISAKENYPPSSHPQGYFFNVDEGRVLSEYQLLYITDGQGIFTYGDSRESQLMDRVQRGGDRPDRRRRLLREPGPGVQYRT